MSESLNLFRLQKLDSEIDRTRARLDEIDKALSEDKRLKNTNKKFEKAQQEAKSIRIKLNQIEDKVEAQRIKRKTTQDALFGGKVKNPKELQDLEMESEALKRYISQLEEEQFEAMIEFETAEGNLNAAQQDLEVIKGLLIQENASFKGEQNMLNESLSRLLREKDAVQQSIPPKNQSLYQQLRDSRRGTAVASVLDGGCGICGQPLTPADLQTIRSSTGVVFCPTCGRILYDG